MRAARVACVVLALAGCAHPPIYVETRPVGDYNATAWFYDGPTLVFTIHNDTSTDRSVMLECVDGDHGPFEVPAHGEVSALGRLSTTDVHDDYCEAQ